MITIAAIKLLLLLALSGVLASWATYALMRRIILSKEEKVILSVEIRKCGEGMYSSRVNTRGKFAHLVGPAIVPALKGNKNLRISLATALELADSLPDIKEGDVLTITGITKEGGAKDEN